MNKPIYRHDCDQCKFLGTLVKTVVSGPHRVRETQTIDLYYCPQEGLSPTVVARFSSDGPDYISGFNSTEAPLVEARNRARALGYIGD